MRLGFGRRVKPKQFEYVPRYYDEQKERLDNLLQEFDAENDNSVEAMKARIKMGYSSRPYYYDKNRVASQQRKKSNIRTLLIIGIICFIIFYILSTNTQEILDLAK